MIRVYTTSGSSSRKAKEWLVEHQLEFEEINWRTCGMSRDEFNKIISLTESGIQEIISKKSLAYSFFSKTMNSLSIEEIFIWLHNERSLLRLPLIVDERHLQIGYNLENIRQFIPRKNREVERMG